MDLGTGSPVNGLNSAGQVTGGINFTGATSHAFLSGPNGHTLHDLGTLGGTSSYGQAVNDSGQVAGYSQVGSGDNHAFLSGPNGGTLQDLGTLGGVGD